mgnify:CR=1 FL=1
MEVRVYNSNTIKTIQDENDKIFVNLYEQNEQQIKKKQFASNNYLEINNANDKYFIYVLKTQIVY